jgi:hypothetical protein
MSASDNVSNEQLAMFMPAKEIMDKLNYSDDGVISPRFWARKLKEAKTGTVEDSHTSRRGRQKSLYESVKEEGVQKPVELRETLVPSIFTPKGHQLLQGHHRVAAAADIDPNMLIPVTHSYTKWKPDPLLKGENK